MFPSILSERRAEETQMMIMEKEKMKSLIKDEQAGKTP